MPIPVAALAAILSLAPAEGDRAKLQGTWVGKTDAAGQAIDAEVQFQGDMVVMTFTVNGRAQVGRGGYKLDEAARPKTLDLVDFRAPEDTPPRPAPPFIYAVEGDTLKLCGAGNPDQPRPTEFKSAGSGPTRTVLLELTRKPASK